MNQFMVEIFLIILIDKYNKEFDIHNRIFIIFNNNNNKPFNTINILFQHYHFKYLYSLFFLYITFVFSTFHSLKIHRQLNIYHFLDQYFVFLLFSKNIPLYSRVICISWNIIEKLWSNNLHNILEYLEWF